MTRSKNPLEVFDGSPGDYSSVLSVGSTNISDTLSSFSNKGPGAFRMLKPDVVAPGENIRSTMNGSDTAYGFSSGTSMAAPHVTGATALLLDVRHNLSTKRILKLFLRNTNQTLNSPQGATNCGGRDNNVFPNPIYGWGLIDVFASVQEMVL